jgi:polysaccharide biosynthesis/export protein
MTKRKLQSPTWLRLLVSALIPLTALAQAPAPASPPAGAGGAAADYIIGPGDTLDVTVYRNPDLSRTIPVRPDGKISTPLVEDMVAVGKTSSGLARDIEKALSEYVRSPQVNVIVTQAVSASSKVEIVGQVKQPQAIPYRAGLTVLDALLVSGGLSEFAAGNRATLKRTVNGKVQEIKIKLDRLLNKGDTSQNLPLQAGDIIFVPQSRF